jgi:hypothetical protein
MSFWNADGSALARVAFSGRRCDCFSGGWLGGSSGVRSLQLRAKRSRSITPQIPRETPLKAGWRSRSSPAAKFGSSIAGFTPSRLGKFFLAAVIGWSRTAKPRESHQGPAFIILRESAPVHRHGQVHRPACGNRCAPAERIALAEQAKKNRETHCYEIYRFPEAEKHYRGPLRASTCAADRARFSEISSDQRIKCSVWRFCTRA